MKTAVIYARYSSDNQTEQSIEGQLHVCQEYAKSHDILILDTYIDRAMTGTNDNRPDFKRMIRDSAKKKWDYVLVYKLDRFSRNKYEATIHKHTLKQNGVKLLSAMENIPDSPEGIILESLLEGMNQYYSAELAQKVKRGMREMRRKGWYQGGGLLYGYKIVDHKIVIDEEKAEAVRFLFTEYSKGSPVPIIAQELFRKGFTFKGGNFSRNTLYMMLHNTKYLGYYYYCDERIDNMYPRIISDELYAKVASICRKNKNGKRSTQTRYLLRKKLICGYCGMPISSETGTCKNGVVKRYYKCTGRRNHTCTKANIRKEELEGMVIRLLQTELSKPEKMDQIVKTVLKLQDRTSQSDMTLGRLTRESAEVDKSLANLIRAMEQGVFSETTLARLRELEGRQKELERNIAEEKAKQEVRLDENAVRSYYHAVLREHIPSMIFLLIKEIVLYDDRAEIYLHTPTANGPEDNRGCFLFVGKETLGQKRKGGAPLCRSAVPVDFYLSGQ